MIDFKEKFCINCGTPLIKKEIAARERLACEKAVCNFVLWNNPIPVVAGIVETSKGVILAHNKSWPENIFSMITGFIESHESPEIAILRETEEELNLIGSSPSLVNIYPFNERNQIIIVYHVHAEGEIKLNDELDSFKIFTRNELKCWPFGQDKLKGWPFGCGWAIRDWLYKLNSVN